ncbi:hypothetical protein CRYUN_Cryun40dG0049100 [Craigia yunnanensis]
MVLNRINKEIKDLKTDLSTFFTITPVADNMFHWEATIMDPEDNPFANGVFHLTIHFPPTYPLQPPKALRVAKDLFPRVLTGNDFQPSEDVVISIDKLRLRLLQEGSGEAVTKDCESIMLLKLSEMQNQLKALQRKHFKLLDTLRKSEMEKIELEATVVPLDISNVVTKSGEEEKRCSFITPNSDPIYVAYHDEEWGVPIHDDSKLFELLILSGAQVGSDWTSILKKRQDFRDAFSGFDAETVANFTEKQMITISSEYGIEISKVRGVVDNSNRILEVMGEFGSFDKYIWGFVNHKPISTQYKFGNKIPVKTSKSKSISNDMGRGDRVRIGELDGGNVEGRGSKAIKRGRS